MTRTAIPICSLMTCRGFSFWLLAIYQLKIHKSANPHIALTIVATIRLEKISTGMMKVIATKNFAKKVAIVDSQTSFALFARSDSCEIWIHKASEQASAIAIVKIHPMTAIFKFVPTLNPIINPRVVMIPEVIQNANQVLSDCFMDFLRSKKAGPSLRGA